MLARQKIASSYLLKPSFWSLLTWVMRGLVALCWCTMLYKSGCFLKNGMEKCKEIDFFFVSLE